MRAASYSPHWRRYFVANAISSRLRRLDLGEASEAGSCQINWTSTLARPALPSNLSHKRHVVQFYEDDTDLLDCLCALFRDTLYEGKSLEALMTRPRRSVIEERWEAKHRHKRSKKEWSA